MSSDSIILESSAAEASRLLDWLDPLLAESPLDEMSAFHFRCALVEVFNNSIVHAYGNKPGHPIVVALLATPDKITLEIRDEGLEFNAPTAGVQSDPLAESGRGFEIIHAWVDEIDFERDGQWNLCRISRRF